MAQNMEGSNNFEHLIELDLSPIDPKKEITKVEQ